MYNTRASVSCVSLLLSITTQKLALTGSPVKPGGGGGSGLVCVLVRNRSNQVSGFIMEEDTPNSGTLCTAFQQVDIS